jgi:hypothetical protein
MSQFDFKAGTRGEGACIFSGKDNPANPTTKSEIGLLTEPINPMRALFSIKILVDVNPQARNIKDSYKLLNGKYPFTNHRKLSKLKSNTLVTTIPPNLTFVKIFTLGKIKLAQ